MKNYEKYKAELIECLVKGNIPGFIKENKKIVKCEETRCSKCLFNSENEKCDYVMRKWLSEEATLDILDDVEKEYLGNLIKPFKVKYISKKTASFASYNCFLVISVSGIDNDEKIYLPWFYKTSNMYKGMLLNRNYTLEELGLD